MSARGLLRTASAAAATVLLATTVAAAAAEPGLTRSWFKVEVIVFERPALDETAAGERLETTTPGVLPRNAVPLHYDDAERYWIYGLSPEEIAAHQPPPPRPEFDALIARVFQDVFDDAPPAGSAQDQLDQGDAADGATAGARSDVDRTQAAPEDDEVRVMEPRYTAEEIARQARRAALQAFEAELAESAYQPLPASDFAMTREAARLTTNPGFTVVWHTAWRQPVPDRDSALPVLIQAGPRLGDRWTYEGTLSVTLGRFLHTHTQLWRATDTTTSSRLTSSLLQPTALGAVRPERRFSYERLDEQRRMRSSEVHYLDHPRFGVLVRIEPVTIPERLQASETSEAFDEAAQ